MTMKTPTLARTRYLIPIACALLVAGCATRPQMPIPQPQPEPQPRPPQQPERGKPLPPSQPPQVSRPQQPVQPARPAPPRKPEKISSPAVMALLSSADTLARAGHMRRAAAALERALNIEPRNPFIYQRLAQVRFAQGQFGQAQALAHKSNSLAVGNPFVRANNWELIAESRRLAGNQAGYRKAMTKVEKYRLRKAAY